MASLLITGPTGNVGREVVAALRARGVEPRLALRPGSRSLDGDVVPLDVTDPATHRNAVKDCEALFLLRPPAVSDTKRTLNPLVDAARAAGVQRIVFLSVAGAADRRWVPHHAVEQRLRSGPRDWTLLRPGFFAQNLGTAYRSDILEDDRVLLPAGDGRVAFVDLRDVGEVAARVLTELDRHAGETYTLTGPAAYTFDQVAEALTAALGRPIAYRRASALGYVRHLRRAGLPWGQVLVQTVLHVGLRFGQAEAVDGTLERLLGRRPRDVVRYIQDHRDLWIRGEVPPVRSAGAEAGSAVPGS